jgi:hypothetical protein
MSPQDYPTLRATTNVWALKDTSVLESTIGTPQREEDATLQRARTDCGHVLSSKVGVHERRVRDGHATGPHIVSKGLQ